MLRRAEPTTVTVVTYTRCEETSPVLVWAAGAGAGTVLVLRESVAAILENAASVVSGESYLIEFRRSDGDIRVNHRAQAFAPNA